MPFYWRRAWSRLGTQPLFLGSFVAVDFCPADKTTLGGLCLIFGASLHRRRLDILWPQWVNWQLGLALALLVDCTVCPTLLWTQFPVCCFSDPLFEQCLRLILRHRLRNRWYSQLLVRTLPRLRGEVDSCRIGSNFEAGVIPWKSRTVSDVVVQPTFELRKWLNPMLLELFCHPRRGLVVRLVFWPVCFWRCEVQLPLTGCNCWGAVDSTQYEWLFAPCCRYCGAEYGRRTLCLGQ